MLVFSIGRTATIAALAAVAVSGLVMPGSAYADSPSVELRVCNKGGYSLDKVSVYGTDQNGKSKTLNSDLHYLTKGSCNTFTNWWWKKGTNLGLSWSNYAGTEHGSISGQVPTGGSSVIVYYT